MPRWKYSPFVLVPHPNFQIDDDPGRVDFTKVHAWLTTAYWCPGVSRESVEKSAKYSALVVGAYTDAGQVGYCRVVSDRTTFAWLCDVWVDEGARGKGVAHAMVKFAVEHPDLQGLRRWLLATKDAHAIYEEFGFKVLENPERWMIRGQQVPAIS